MRGASRFLLSLTSLAICATAALALPPKAEAVIRLGQVNMVSLTNGLVGYWTFDGPVTDWNSNTTRDLSGNGNTGSLVSMSTSSSPAIGKIGQAFKFDGISQSVTFDDLSFPSGSAPRTVSLWFKSTNTGAYKEMVRYGNGGVGGKVFFYLNVDSLNVDTNFTNWNANTIGLNDGKWHMGSFTYDGATTRIYVDGRLDGTNTQTFDTALCGTCETYIGGFGSRAFPGLLDDVRIYNRALSASEIQQLYKSGAVTIGHSNAIISDGLVGYWTFDGPNTDWVTGKAKDSAGNGNGNGNDGQLLGMSTTSSPTVGKIGQALKFTGPDYVHSTNITALNNATAFSISAWVKRGAVGTKVLLGKGTVSDGYESMELWDDGNAYFETSTAGSPAYGSVSLSDSNWHHLVEVYDGSQSGNASRLKGYIDGVRQELSFTGTVPATTANNSDAFDIGRYLTGDNSVSQGNIDDVRIYNRALSATEIKQLYTAGR